MEGDSVVQRAPQEGDTDLSIQGSDSGVRYTLIAGYSLVK